ncbi:hypothetical protein [Syntrophotalea acetylenivorans]|uniref:hypothetical protein n=1 Tax=Syntrophotalea acetylenivorans TaxID=1842532 RepID=UPI0011AB2F5B|nr:hypothetical protein [Syntrophotalea acetylenivorans]
MEAPLLVEGATYSHFVVRVPDRRKENEFFAKNGVQLGELIQYSVPGLANYEKLEDKFVKSELASKTTINIPISPDLKIKDLEKIKKIINKK